MANEELEQKAQQRVRETKEILEVITKPVEVDAVNSPEHYNMLDIEAINLIEMSMTKEEFLGYLKGNVLKYIIRYKHKGNASEDLDKGKWYLDKLRNKINDQSSN
tara:strand:- start:1101 stop:1415 length:315 start_codon:yes stop_codon:yes gene_type:complete